MSPSYWTYDTVEGVIVAKDPYVGEAAQPNVRNEISAHVQGNVTRHYFPHGRRVGTSPPLPSL